VSNTQSPSKESSPFAVICLNGPPPPLDAEFKPRDATEVFNQCGLSFGRCFGSKSGYRNAHPGCLFVPNANVFSLKQGKLWWGDLDLKHDAGALNRVARKLGCQLYVLREMDGRFEEAVIPEKEIVERAVWRTGGPARVPGVARFLKRSGLTVSQASIIAGLKRGRMTQLQPQEVVLQIHKRLTKYEEVFGPVAGKLGYKKWGQWWTMANEQLSGRSPLEVLKAGGAVDLGKLLGDRLGDEWRFDCWDLTILLHKRL
jgi:hypothetical protein